MEKRTIQPLGFILSLFLTAIALMGVLFFPWKESLIGLWRIQVNPGRLISDFFALAGPGAALLNGALVGAIGLLFVKLTKVSLSGPTFAAVLTMTGFGFFGKTPLNILPIIFGVWLAAKLVNKGLRDYLIIALFGTALGPLINAVALELGLPQPWGVLASVAAGLTTGFFLPSIAVSMLHLHQGYNLYNMGLSCGFFGLFAASLIKGFGRPLAGESLWYDTPAPVLIWFIPVLSTLFILYAFLRKKKAAWKDFLSVQKVSGRLPSDFVDLSSLEGALLNSGLVGWLSWAYVYFIGGDFNGPILGGILTIMGFGAFGTHLRNSWSVVTGVVAATLITGKELTAPGPLLAFIFSTTLGPLAGQFGVLTGIAAGFIHLIMVSQTGAWHGGMNLYNNGFAGGITAALFVSVIQWYRTNKAQF